MLKRLTVLLLFVVTTTVFFSCTEDDSTDPIIYDEFTVQTDWSGGGTQVDMLDSNKFNVSAGIDFTSTPGEITISGDYFVTNDAQTYNGKLYVCVTGYGTFEYDPTSDVWKLSLAGHYWRFSYVFDGKLYTLYSGVEIKTYDGTTNDYGLGPNGWAVFNNDGLPAYGEVDPYLNIFDFTEFNSELYACGGLWNGTTNQSAGGQVYKFNGTAWEQVGATTENSSNAIVAYDGELYWGTHWSGDLFKLVGGVWTYTGHSFGMSVTDLVVCNDKLYVASWNTSYVTGYVDEFDGTNWVRRYNGEAVTELTVHNNMITWGTNPGGKIFQLSNDPAPWVVNLYDLGITCISGLVSVNGDLYNGCGYQTAPNVRDNFIYKNGVQEKKLECCMLVSSGYSSIENTWGNIVWNCDEPAGTGVEVWVQGKDSAAAWPMYTEYNWTQMVNDTPIELDGQDMRYKVYLWSTEDGVTPTFEDISLKVEQ
ncbi:MAG: hypothetical protein JXR69_00020 [Candidatus Delongbacteria bacterium]|nr:hypothetical protein [Candidatus Delongbacteria bacterium]